MRGTRPHLLRAPRAPGRRAPAETRGAAATGRRRGGDHRLKDTAEGPLSPARGRIRRLAGPGPERGNWARRRERVRADTRGARVGTREGTRGGLVPGSGAAAGPLRRRSRPLLLETGKRCPRQPRAHEPRRLCPAPRRRGDPREGDPREGDAGTAGKPSNEGVRLSTFSSELGEVSPSLLAPPQAPHAFLVLPPPFSDRGKNRRGDVCANSRRP